MLKFLGGLDLFQMPQALPKAHDNAVNLEPVLFHFEHFFLILVLFHVLELRSQRHRHPLPVEGLLHMERQGVVVAMIRIAIWHFDVRGAYSVLELGL